MLGAEAFEILALFALSAHIATLLIYRIDWMLASKALGKAFLVSNLVLIRLVVAIREGNICPWLGLP